MTASPQETTRLLGHAEGALTPIAPGDPAGCIMHGS